MTSKSIRQAQYNSGTIMFEPRCHIVAFKMAGLHFSSNMKRHKAYSFKTMTWRKGKDQGLLAKVTAIANGSVHRVSAR